MGRSGASSSRGPAEKRPAGEEEPPSNQLLPRSSVVRMMRQVLAADVKVAGRAKALAQDCASEFIRAVVDWADERCRQQERRMVSPEDLAWSLRRLDLDGCAGPLGTYLSRYREATRDTRSSRAPPTVEDFTDEELVQIVAQIMNDADGKSS